MKNLPHTAQPLEDERMTDVPNDRYLIRKHGLYYAPNSQGYTGIRDKAGRYTLTEAIARAHPNGKDGPRDGMDYIHESEAPEFSPKCFEDLKVKHLAEARDKLATDLAAALAREAALRDEVERLKSTNNRFWMANLRLIDERDRAALGAKT